MYVAIDNVGIFETIGCVLLGCIIYTFFVNALTMHDDSEISMLSQLCYFNLISMCISLFLYFFLVCVCMCDLLPFDPLSFFFSQPIFIFAVSILDLFPLLFAQKPLSLFVHQLVVKLIMELV